MSAGISAVYCTPSVRFLRMLTNSFLAGALAASYVVVLFLQLNPALPLNPGAIGPLALGVGLFYAFAVAAIVYVLLLVRVLLGRDRFSPAWISVSVVTWAGFAIAAAAAAEMWANLDTFGVVLQAKTTESLWQSAIVVGIAAVWLLALAITQHYSPRRGVWAAAVCAVAVLSVVIPVVLRGPTTGLSPELAPVTRVLDVPIEERSGHVTVIALDAGSLELVTNATSEGRLPNFGRILDAGAVANLATLHPTSAEAVWAAIATGKFPQKNGIRSAAEYRLPRRPDETPIQLLPVYCFANGLLRFDVLHEEPHNATALRARPLWTILSAAGVSTGVVNFPLTYPAASVNGFIVSDAYLRSSDSSTRQSDPAMLSPSDLEDGAATLLRSDNAITPLPGLEGLPERHKAPARIDQQYQRIHQWLTTTRPVQVSLMRFQSPDQIGHYFLRYAVPSRFGDVSDEDRRRYGGLLEAHYALVDEAIGLAIDTLGPDDLLLVVSGYGMEPLSVSKRLLEQVVGDPEISGSHDAAPDGFLMAYGASVVRAKQLRRASIVDVLPTILYFLGLPVSRDMDGYARPDLFVPSFTDERPITFIPSYDK
jgi:predicted AlkP superfamily phosphohydrolase/phosphomutase